MRPEVSVVIPMRNEAPNCRDIAYYVPEPHVVLAAAPLELFLDPSHSYRLDLGTYRSARRAPRGFSVRRLCSAEDADEVNRLYATRGMVAVDPHFFWSRRGNRSLLYLVAEDEASGRSLVYAPGVPGPDDVLVDLTRNRSRRFCSTTCGNRVAAAAYRERQAAEGDGRAGGA